MPPVLAARDSLVPLAFEAALVKPAVWPTGGGDGKRIGGIMASRFIGQLRIWTRLRLTVLLAAAVVCPFLPGVPGAEAQTASPTSGSGQPARKLEFGVASVKARPRLQRGRLA
jgi:hypothetical protein